MGRKAKGKPLTLMPIRVDEDVRAAILKLKDQHDTINEGLRTVFFGRGLERVLAIQTETDRIVRKIVPAPLPQSTKRGIRPKGDAKR